MSTAALLNARVCSADEARDLFDQLVRLGEKRVMQLKHGGDVLQTASQIEDVKRQLSTLANAGDPSGAYHLALVYAADCGRSALDLPQIERMFAASCRSSNVLYRRAAEKGHYSAAAELADAYRDGRGVAQSGLAAVEWYYKAGRLALKDNNRDFALRALEEILKISPNHRLSGDLKEHLYGPAAPAKPEKRPPNNSRAM